MKNYGRVSDPKDLTTVEYVTQQLDAKYDAVDGEALETSLNAVQAKVDRYLDKTVVVTLTDKSGGTSITTAADVDVNLSFEFISTEDGASTGNATCSVEVGGIVKSTTNIPQGTNSVNVKDYLSPGTNTVKVTCTDAYGSSKTLVYTVTVVVLSLESSFDDTMVYTGDITFKYTPYGALSKTVYYTWDDGTPTAETVTTSGQQVTKVFPAMTHGAHRLKVYATASLNGVTITSNTLIYEVACAVSGNNNVIITMLCDQSNVTEGELVSTSFMVYDPTSATANVTLTIQGGNDVYSTQTRTVGRSKEIWSTRRYPTGAVVFKIVCGTAERSHAITVSESSIQISAVANDLELVLSSAGRSNSETTPNTWSYGTTTTTFTGVNWDTTGWVQDENGDTVLRLFGAARANIGFKPFSSDLRAYGKTIEIEFAIRDINNRDAVVASCVDNGVGIQITADRAKLSSEQSTIDCRFADDEKLRVSFVVESRSEHRLMSVYLNGILSGACQYPDNDNFQQDSPVNITLGSDLCGIDVYTIRSYSTALSYNEVRDNYIADTTDIAIKTELYNDNDIYDAYGALSYDMVKAKIPVMTIIGALPTSKGDKKSVRIIYEDPFNSSLNFDTRDDTGPCTIDVQGTSSQWYVRKNWKLKFTNEHTHVAGMLPSKVFCMKADYAEATGTHNTQNANLAGTLYTTQTPPQEDDDRVRTTIYGFPCVIYHRATEQSAPVFSGKYNFNYDKGSESVYGFSSSYPNAESWEFRDNTSDACLFHAPLGADWADHFEARYPEDCSNISFFQSMHSWVVSTYQDGATNAALSSSYTGTDGTVYTTDSAAYRLAKFKKEFSAHFNLEFCLLYYVYTFVMLMVDQRAKNMFLTTWDRVHWEPWLYDNDTCLGINNEGALVFDYYHEDGDQLNGANVYNGQTSTLWINFKAAFATEIQTLYQTLRNTGKLTPEIVYSYFLTNGANKWSESIYNEDTMYKYVSMLLSDNDASNLDQIRGSGESHLRYFVKNRFKYCDSRWYAADYADDYATLRIYTPVNSSGAAQTGLAVAANANITVTPFSNMYAGVRYKANGTLQQARATKNTPITFTAPSETFNDTETAIYGASELSSIGDLAPLYCGSVKVAKATKLTHLKIGDSTSGYSNPNLTEIAVGTNKLLKTIDVRNCPNLTAPLALAGCPNIENIYADGSGITGVELPSSGYLKNLALPGTITNLTLLNQAHLVSFVCAGYSSLTTLRIENTPNVPVSTIVNSATNLTRVRLLNVSLTCPDTTTIDRLMQCGGLDENGNNITNSVVTGTLYVSTLTQTKLNQIRAFYPNLTVTYGTLEVEYTLLFKDWDGTTLDQQSVGKNADGVDPITSGRISTPTRAGTAQYTYTFSGWSGVYTNVTSNRTITAQYTQTINSYTIRFISEGAVLQSDVLNYGATPSYTGDLPEKDGYVFSGWTPSISTVVSNQDYVATFAELVPPTSVKTFGECTWAEIKAVASSGYKNSSNQWCILRNGAEEVWWDIGDEKTITLTDGEEVTLMIYDFQHDDLPNGGKAPLTIGMKHLLATTASMNSTGTNSGGWGSSKMRTTTIPAIYNRLPGELQGVISDVYKYTSAGSQSTTINTTVDSLFLFSEVEVDGTTTSVYCDEGTKYPVFTNDSSRIKKLSNGTGSADSWWLRSPSTGSTNGFPCVSGYGRVYSDDASYTYGVAFGFCV